MLKQEGKLLKIFCLNKEINKQNKHPIKNLS